VHGQLTVGFNQANYRAELLQTDKSAFVAVTGRWHDTYLPPKTFFNNELFGQTFNVFSHVKLSHFLEGHAPRQLVIAVTDQRLCAEGGRGHSRAIFEDPAKMFNMLYAYFFSD
jgi:hypothetical protein